MSVVIVGGNERMVCLYEGICQEHGCKAKIFVKEKGAMRKKLGTPDLMILFTKTVSHKMAMSATKEAQKWQIPVERVASSSGTALRRALKKYKMEA